MTLEELTEKTILWAREKGITDPKTQLCHVLEEIGEMATELNKNRADGDGMKDAIGDSLVTVIVFADTLGIDPKECLEMAYNEIKDRTGVTVGHSFIKDVDLGEK